MPDAPRRRDVEGHAAAARHRAGADRRRRGCCCSTSRRARSTPPAAATVRALLERLRERGVGVLLNSHLLSEVELVCDRVAIIDGGAVVAAGTPAELSHAGGVEVETARGVAPLPGRAARGRAADRAPSSSPPARTSTRVRVLHLHARGRLPRRRRAHAGAGRGGRGVSAPGSGPTEWQAALLIARFALRESLRRRVFVVDRAAHLRLPRALRARGVAGVQGHGRVRDGDVDRRGRHAGRRRGDARGPGDVRDPLPRRRSSPSS